LEKEDAVTDDPRGIYLAGDSVRILWALRIKEKEMREIGERMFTILMSGDEPSADDLVFVEVAVVNLHKTDFKRPPFFKLDTWTDFLNQVVADGLAQSQPKLGISSLF